MSELRILMLENSSADAERIQSHLANAGLVFTTTRVQTGETFRRALAQFCPDIILADYLLPSFDGLSALKIALETCPHVPFIFVSGAVGEEVAIETLTSGATDYVHKYRLERLAPAVKRALREAHERSERSRLEEELRERAEELAEAHRRKDEFLAMLSHELRNPLAPIRNALELLRLPGTQPAMNGEARDIIDRQVDHISRLVDDLLDISRIGRGKIQLRQQPVDLSATAGYAVETVRPLIEKRQHRLAISIAEPLWVLGDPLRLNQIVTNLLNNAAKYTEPGGEISLTTCHDGDRAILRVRDNGIGIAPELLPRVFDMFMQADPDRERSQGGLGIGLTLARRLVELHGGRIQAASAGLGQGSAFSLSFPLYAGQAPAREAPAPARKAQSPGAKRVVVVDDNRDGAHSLATLLRCWGHEVRETHDGPAALEAVQSLRPDVVLLDIGLPGMDGYQVAHRLRAMPTGGMTLVAITGYGQDEDRRRALEAGFNHHLTKPVDAEALQALLAQPATAYDSSPAKIESN